MKEATMTTPRGQTQRNARAAHQKTLGLKEGLEVETTMGMGKVKVWISEKLGAKIANRVFRGLALGILLAAGTGLYFSINQGEAGSPLVSEQIQCYPEDHVVCLHDRFLADVLDEPVLTTGNPAEFYNRSAYIQALNADEIVDATPFIDDVGEAGSSLVSERIGCYPEDNVVCLYDQFLADVLDEPVLTAGNPAEFYNRSAYIQALNADEMVDATPFIDDVGEAGSHPSINGIRCYPEDNC
jgi:hypothetical protein